MSVTRLISAVSLLALLLAACGGGSDDSGGAGTGTLSLKITDSPVDDAGAVVVVFTGVELKPSDGAPFSIDFCDFDSDPASCPDIDLLRLQDGVTDDLLTGEEVPAGVYNWMRLKVVAERNLQNGSYIMIDGGMYPLFVPSGSATGLKLNRPFVVAQGGITRLVADFDIRKSVIAPPGLDPYYLLKPVVRLMDELETGTIEGQVDLAELAAAQDLDPAEECAGGVYLYSGFGAVPDDMDTDGTPGDGIDPIVYESLAVDPMVGGTVAYYMLPLVEAGDYTVAFTCDFDVDASPEISEYDPDALDGEEGFETMRWTTGTDATDNPDIVVGVDETVVVDFIALP